MDYRDSSIFRPRIRWTYPEIEKLWQIAGMTMEQWAAEVDIPISTLNRYRLAMDRPDIYEAVGARNGQKINQWCLSRQQISTNHRALSSPDLFENAGEIKRQIREILIEHIPDDYLSLHIYSGKGIIHVRRLLTICPNCNYCDERKYEIRGIGMLREILDSIRNWISGRNNNEKI